ncbi:protein geranylgeranyltransferase type I [Malassezia nana]|uniref:Protein geranylgeranyltransferase type I n=1 Tax=Malassezia nana TaxID=180528 RepID=A0AAF0ENW1_9BASI|nr:protein geranylgeranyltransferase type I [Malassezia nana]
MSRGGFQGRVEKDQDTCYSFWCGASLRILHAHEFVNGMADTQWIFSAKSSMGGFAKVPGEHPDVLHSYLSYVALAMHSEENVQCLEGTLASVSAALNLTRRSLAWIYTQLWQNHPSGAPLP